MSYKSKRLLVISISIIILATAANESNKEDYRDALRAASRISMPTYVLAQFDSNALSENVAPAPVPEKVAPKPEPKVQSIVPKPIISAESYLVANLETGEVYLKHNPEKVFPIASLSKLITAHLAKNNMDMGKEIVITETMLDGYGDAGGLVLGETLSVSELLYPLLLESSNDAAEALAEDFGYQNFITSMNGFVKDLGMYSTSFKDPSGMSSGNTSNANDLFILAKYLFQNDKELLQITRKVNMEIGSTTEHGEHLFNTINPFPLYPNFLGGKTGRTVEAKESMISLFKYEYNGTSYSIAIIVLRSGFSTREIDSTKLFLQFINKVNPQSP